MGNKLTITSFPNLKTELSIAEKWKMSSFINLPLEERADIIIQGIESLINAYFIGLNRRPDYLFLVCESAIAKETADYLLTRKEMGGLEIEATRRLSSNKLKCGINIELSKPPEYYSEIIPCESPKEIISEQDVNISICYPGIVTPSILIASKEVGISFGKQDKPGEIGFWLYTSID